MSVARRRHTREKSDYKTMLRINIFFVCECVRVRSWIIKQVCGDNRFVYEGVSVHKFNGKIESTPASASGLSKMALGCAACRRSSVIAARACSNSPPCEFCKWQLHDYVIAREGRVLSLWLFLKLSEASRWSERLSYSLIAFIRCTFIFRGTFPHARRQPCATIGAVFVPAHFLSIAPLVIACN